RQPALCRSDLIRLIRGSMHKDVSVFSWRIEAMSQPGWIPDRDDKWAVPAPVQALAAPGDDGDRVWHFTCDDAGRLVRTEQPPPETELIQLWITYDAEGNCISRRLVRPIDGPSPVAAPVDTRTTAFRPLGFTGHDFDADLGLLHFGARDYDPTYG